MSTNVKNSRNNELTMLAKGNVAGGTDSLMRLPSYHLPLVISKSQSAFVWDAEGNELIDMNMGYGPLIFGHRSPIVIDAIKRELDIRGSVLGFIHELSSEAAELIKQNYPSIDLLRFSSTGSEVAQTAIRLARAYTNRQNIVLFEGHYHGSTDAVFHNYHAELTDLDNYGIYDVGPGTNGMNGAPNNVFRLRWNDTEALEQLFAEHGESIAAVVMEPVMGNAGVIPPISGYLEFVRKLTDRYGSLLIFDEIITGCRVARGGAQERFGVRSDITLLSKAINGGVPLSAIGGRKDIMNLLSEGIVFHGGVYSGNPMSLAATIAVQKELICNGESIYQDLNNNSTFLMENIEGIFSRKGIAVKSQHVGAMLTISFMSSDHVESIHDYRSLLRHSNRMRYIVFQQNLQRRGVYIHPNQFEPWYLSTAHSRDVLDVVLDTVETVVKEIDWSKV